MTLADLRSRRDAIKRLLSLPGMRGPYAAQLLSELNTINSDIAKRTTYKLPDYIKRDLSGKQLDTVVINGCHYVRLS